MCDCWFNTQILIDQDKPYQGLFIFSPDIFTIPVGSFCLDGPNDAIKPINVNIQVNRKHDYKFELLDDNAVVIDSLCISCNYQIKDISELFVDVSSSILELYQKYYLYTDNKSNFTKIIQIDVCNLQLMANYIQFEQNAYYYRKVTQSYLNLWNNAEQYDLLCELLKISKNAQTILIEDNKPDFAAQVYILINYFILSRSSAIHKLCQCGIKLNDSLFLQKNSCGALK